MPNNFEPWTTMEIKLGSTRMESEIERAVRCINQFHKLLEACYYCASILEHVEFPDEQQQQAMLHVLNGAIGEVERHEN